MYCSRCNGLLLEGFLQIVMYGKSLLQDGIVLCNGRKISNVKIVEDACLTNKCDDDEIQDPSVHPWGGLTTTRDGTLTLLDCYLYSKSLKGLQNVRKVYTYLIVASLFLFTWSGNVLYLTFHSIRYLVVPEQGNVSVNYFILMHVGVEVVDG